MTAQVVLKDIVFFRQLDEAELASVATALQTRHLNAGEVLFNMGDPGDELIIVQEGRIAIYAPLSGDPKGGQAIRIFQAGEMLGEMALIDRKPRSLSARAEEKSVILALSGEAFRRLLSENPEMSFAVMSGLSDRIRYTTDFLSEVHEWVRRMADGSYQVLAERKPSGYQDQTLAALAAEFARMAARVQEREETLRREVAQLKIEIDESKRQQESSKIMETDYYKSLREKVKQLRQTRDE